MKVWQKGFSDHRIRDASDYRIHQTYVRENPVRKHLCEHTDEYPYSSAGSRFELDPAPQGLKPLDFDGIRTARLEGAPFQDNIDTLEEALLQSNDFPGSPDGEPAQIKTASGRVETASSEARNRTA